MTGICSRDERNERCDDAALNLSRIRSSFGWNDHKGFTIVETSNCRRGAADRDEEWKSIVEILFLGRGRETRGGVSY